MGKIEKLSFGRDSIVVEIEETGEQITLHVDDQTVYPKLIKLFNSISEKNNNIPELENSDDTGSIDSVLMWFYMVQEDAAKQFNNIFGKDACMKAFGVEVPPVEKIAKFIELVAPYYYEYVEKRFKGIQQVGNKYSAKRTGTV